MPKTSNPSASDRPRLSHERLYWLSQIAKARDLPLKRTRRTWLNYVTRGVEAGDGSVIKLESLPMGNRHQTSKEAVFRFLMALERAREE